MNLLYISASINDELLNKFFTKESKPQFAASKYHSLLAEGFSENGACVEFFSALPVTRNNCNHLLVHPKSELNKTKKSYALIINIPLVKNFVIALFSFFKTLWSPAGTIVVYDCLVISASLGALVAAKIRKMKKICIITDLPVFMDVGSNRKMLSLNNRLIKEASAYVMLTDAMNSAIGNTEKPYIVLEGHCDIRMADFTHDPFKLDKIVMYAGSIFKKYGIEELCMEFIRVHKNNETLHVYGGGDYQEELKHIVLEHSEIKYFGTCKNELIVQKELEASILVNPRVNDDYTAYSFPSKTMEYMASGTPVLMSALNGLPHEYNKYVTVFDETNMQDLGNKLRYLMDLPNEELQRIGELAKAFIVDKKNNVAQAKKILNWISNEVLK